MNSVATKRKQQEVFQTTGTVVVAGASAYRVETEEGDYEAQRAHSCLCAPACGDLVLLAFVPGGAAYVLAVLERGAGPDTHIEVEGNLSIRVGQGRLSVAAQDGIGMTSAKDVSVVSGEVELRAVTATASIERTSFFSSMVQAEMQRVKWIAGTFDSFVDRISQKVKRSYRFIEDFEQLRAGRLDIHAKKLMTLHSENAVISAEELVKVDGEQIHLG